jgi:hypothetical protein
MMIDNRRRTEANRLYPSNQRAEVDALRVERFVERPPDSFEDFPEVPRQPPRSGHASRQGRVEVRVRADQAGEDQPVGEILDGFPAQRGELASAGDDHAAVDSQVGPLQAGGIERHEVRVLDEHDLWSICPAAGGRGAYL